MRVSDCGVVVISECVYRSRTLENMGSASRRRFFMTLGGASNGSEHDAENDDKEAYRSSPNTGSRPWPMESLTLCRLNFSAHTSCISVGRVRKITVTIS